ncbi:hypothetical protein BD309DRAFT_857129 [Dichomitus squalens]|uniref:RING-type E3 ubiquitin transferase n=1 Tax=Dichomitus squalens TaxID=114155 RepID=A0A4V2K260_9APHY|nr:hypothetical protein BD311DRAFT_772538 [Dichomitus squalens]TBU46863.1 hypothetical protein BD309DRAFT_857129 [Dichomitus squalens]
MYYFPTSLMYCIRRSREPRPGFPDDNVEMVGPISQKTAARLALRFYIPQPELSSAPSRPVGPAAFLRPIGRRELDNWDQKFRSMEHPFLRLPKAEAKCLFCLDDYVEPPRVLPVAVEGSSSQLDHAETQGIPVPLRLLACGHHFHKECLDRYITQVSARCPVCRARVQAPPLPGSR